MASPTFGEMAVKVREYMLDTHEPHRYPQWLVISALADGVSTLRQIRPEARYDGLRLTDGALPYVTAESSAQDVESASATPLPVDPRWEMAVRYFACARCFEVDSADTVNLQRAQECQTSFSNLVRM